jgi:hypothetical protein
MPRLEKIIGLPAKKLPTDKVRPRRPAVGMT